MTQETVAGRANSVLAGARGAAPEFAVRFTGALPRTGTGKILKKRLRETHGDG